MAAPRRKDNGFEELLKPLQDVLCKDWEITLTQYLEQYLIFLRGRRDLSMNFSEAALLLQNSTDFYSKRVDLVYKSMNELIDTLRKNANDDEGVERTKRKKTTRVLQCEEMEVLDFVCSDNNIDLKWDKKLKRGERKTVVLNISMKIPCKPNTSYPVYADNGLDIGLKSDFRLNWRINSDGLLQEDFNDNHNKHISRHRELHITDHSHGENEGDGFDAGMDMEGNDGEMEPVPCEIPINENPCSSPFRVDPPEDPPEPEGRVLRSRTMKELQKKKEDPWAPFSIIANIHLLKFKRQTVFKLPKYLAEFNSIKRKRGKTDEKAVKRESESYLFHANIVGSKGILNPIEYQLQEEKNRKNLIAQRRRLGSEFVRRAERDYDDDFLGFSPRSDECGFNDDVDDLDLSNDAGIDDNDECDAIPFPQLNLSNVNLGVVQPIDVRDIRDDTCPNEGFPNAHAHEEYKETRRQLALSSAEVSSRVAAWHEKLRPILSAAEKRSNFDIQQYGTSILNKFPESEENPVLSFRSITEGQSKEEVCRFFLSTLVLANTYNVEIVKTQEGELVKDCLDVKLLSRVRHHDEINENIGEAARDSGH